MTQDPSLASALVAPRKSWCLRMVCLCIGMAAIGGHTTEKSARVGADQPKGDRLWMTAGGQRFAVTLADTDAARAFATRLPMTLDMTDLNDNEKKFDLPSNLPANLTRPGTIRNGDLMLWGNNTVVVFYKTFDSPYSYTRLGKVSDPASLAQALGRGGVRVQFSVQP